MDRYKQNLSFVWPHVYSYGTKVGTVDGDKLIVPRWYSVTTSKHINYVARHYGLTVVKEYEKK